VRGKEKRKLPEGWVIAPFNLLFNNVTSSNLKLKQKLYGQNGKYSVVDQGQALIGGYTDRAELLHPASSPVIVFGDHTRCVKFINFKFVQGADGVKILSPCKVIEPLYSFYLLKNTTLPDKGYSRHFKFLKELSFRVAPLNEQKRIVDKIEELQARSRRAREALETVPDLLEQLRQSILAAAFRGDLTKEWRKRQAGDLEPASELLKRIRVERRKRWEESELEKLKGKGLTGDKLDEVFAKQRKKYKEPSPVDTSNLPELPEGWCWTTIEQISSKVVDGVHKKPNYVEKGIPFVTVKNLTAGPGISFERLNYISPEDHAEFTKRADPAPRDLLVSKDGTLGVIRVVDTDTTFSIFVSVALIKPIDKKTTSWLDIALRSPQGQERLVATGSGLQHIHLRDLRATLLPFPPLEEMKEIEQEVSNLFRFVDDVEILLINSSKYTQSLDQSILSKAFLGELVPQNPEDEPASVLLESIRAKRATVVRRAKN